MSQPVRCAVFRAPLRWCNIPNKVIAAGDVVVPYMKTESTNEKVLSSAGTIENDNLEKELKEEILENEQEENEMESSDIIETSTIDDYIEEDNSSDESY